MGKVTYQKVDDNGVVLKYLIPNKEITEEEYATFVAFYEGNDGPGFQMAVVDGTYLLCTDADAEEIYDKINLDIAIAEGDSEA